MVLQSMLLKHTQFTDFVERVQTHDHICLVYETIKEWCNVVIPFIVSGLRRGEKCIYIQNSVSPKEITKSIFGDTLNMSKKQNDNQLIILKGNAECLKSEPFDPDWMIAFLIAETRKALEEGYSALRITCDMSMIFLYQHDSESLLEYEEKLNKEFLLRYPCLALCQYEKRKFNPEIIKRVLAVHPLLIHRGRVSLNLLYSIFYSGNL